MARSNGDSGVNRRAESAMLHGLRASVTLPPFPLVDWNPEREEIVDSPPEI
jgi:hypothetical protein